ncbi:kinase-like protein, partial [Rickenella mellea]
GNCIGRGALGSVYRALNLEIGEMVAVKRMPLQGMSEDEIQHIMDDVDFFKALSHPNILKYKGASRDTEFLNIVQELADSGSLSQTLKGFGKLNERLVSTYVVKILDTLNYLHQKKIVHCDLKASNILTTKMGGIKLSFTFGVSHEINKESRLDVAGTPNFMAPEVIELKGASPASDIWSLACTIIELLTGKPPYSDVGNSMTVMFRVVEEDMPPIPEECSESLKDFLRSCFQKDPSMRPDIEQLYEHKWLKHNNDWKQALRSQESIPFLRRVTADLERSKVASAALDVDPFGKTTNVNLDAADRWPDIEPYERPLEGLQGPSGRRKPAVARLSDGMKAGPSKARRHSFVKATFDKRETVLIF